MKFIAPVLVAFSLAASIAPGEQAAPSADQVLAPARVRAAAEHKAIFLHFGASWCGWCKRLDAFLARPDIQPVFERYFIPVKLVVQENDRNKALENPGAEALLKDLGGPAGLPYSAFLDAKGALIVNSKHDGQNIGYPGEPNEIDWFVRMMEKAAPRMSREDLKTIETGLRSFKTSSRTYTAIPLKPSEIAAPMSNAAVPPKAAQIWHGSTLALVNQSALSALVRIKGPTSKDVEVPAKESRKINVTDGDYTLRIRFGAAEEDYAYSKGERFSVTDTATTTSENSITFNATLGNYKTDHITKKEFWE